MMNIPVLRDRAHRAGVPIHLFGPATGETSIVRAIQGAAGVSQCFRTEARNACEDYDCEWRRECLRLVADWLR
ncbi:MAG: hypothetical protein AB7Q97_23880 [Gammaproteobacteria bacterium]